MYLKPVPNSNQCHCSYVVVVEVFSIRRLKGFRGMSPGGRLVVELPLKRVVIVSTTGLRPALVCRGRLSGRVLCEMESLSWAECDFFADVSGERQRPSSPRALAHGEIVVHTHGEERREGDLKWRRAKDLWARGPWYCEPSCAGTPSKKCVTNTRRAAPATDQCRRDNIQSRMKRRIFAQEARVRDDANLSLEMRCM